MNKEKEITISLLVVVLILIFAMVLLGKTKDTDSTQSYLESKYESTSYESTSINAREIWNKYDKDPDKNEPTYDGDHIIATGYVKKTGTDDHGTPSIELSDTKNDRSYVLAVFGSYDDFKDIKKGDLITVSGNFHIMSSSNMVVIKESKIEKIYK